MSGPVTLTSGDAAPVEMVDLFHLDGISYQIPAKPRVNVALRYLRTAKKHGETVATGELLESLLGADGFEALTNYDELTPDQFAQIVAAAQKVTLGALEQHAGEGPRGSGR